MALLQVRGFPDDVYDSLSTLARKEQRSVSQQTIVLIRTALGEQEQRKKQRQALLEGLLEEPPVLTGDYPSPADLVREDRDR